MNRQEKTEPRIVLPSEQPEEMSVLVRTIIRSLLPLALVFGLYIISFGHLTPGGGFQGGMILVGGVMTFYLAYGYSILRRFTFDQLEIFEGFAILMFLIIGLVGLTGRGFLYNPFRGGIVGSLFSGGTIPVLNFVVGFKVAAGTLLVIEVLLETLRKGED